MARCHHPLSGPLAARPPHPSPANRAGGRIPAPVPPCTTANRPFAPRTAPIPLATPASPPPTARERSSWQVCCTCSRAPRAARREARPSTPTAAQVRFLPPEAGPAHASDPLAHGRASSPHSATIFLTPPLPSLASLAGSRRAGRRRATTSCSTALASPWAVAHDFGRLRCVRCERVVHARACMLAHACPHLRARAARCSCLCRVGANYNTGSDQRHVHGRRKFKSIHVKQGGSTSFQHQTFDSRACFGRQTTPERKIADAGIRLERFVAGDAAPVDFASETPHASVRSAGGTLSIAELTRCHVVVGQSSDPRADRLSRR